MQEIDSDGLKKYSLTLSGRDYLKDVTLVIHNPTLADMGPYPLEVRACAKNSDTCTKDHAP